MPDTREKALEHLIDVMVKDTLASGAELSEEEVRQQVVSSVSFVVSNDMTPREIRLIARVYTET